MQPRPPSALNHVKADIPTPNGIISVEWTKKDGKFNLSVVVPEGTTADVIMPSGERRQFMSGSHRLSCPRESGTRRKTVLLLGDSICMGYAPYVRELMKDRADVVYPKRNCMFACYTLRMIWEWSRLVDDPKSVDVVHFNNGLWDLGQRDGRDCLTPVDVYASTLRRIVDELRHFFPNARIIFATTTPINEKTFCEQHTKGNAEVERYNAAARKILSGSVDAINDLYAFVRENKVDRHYKDIVHFHDEGYRILAGQVVKSIDSFSTPAPMR
ncbi:MAG: hypothetical protein IKK82_00790 [Kiritimatiellae bacterium]|nr:hypothetical protein [Kiritimatiellia bacterium]